MSTRRSPKSVETAQELVDFFVAMYSVGAFPMAEPLTVKQRGQVREIEPEIHWYRPDPRAVLPLTDGSLRVWDGLKKARKQRPFVFTANACFVRVIEACAEPGPGRGGAGETWLCPSLISCYTTLHAHGRAHSIEAWLPAGECDSRGGFVSSPPEGATLVGGVYGVSIGAAFFAESMFSRPALGGSNASSLALVELWEHLRRCGYALLDVQISNHHTKQFGVMDVPCDEYLRMVENAIDKADAWKAPA